MDDLLNKYTYEELVAQLEKGRYWYMGGEFFTDDERTELIKEKLSDDHPYANLTFTCVENAVYFRKENELY